MAALPDSSVVALEEYLRTSYDPDVEFVDGVLVERNVGEQHPGCAPPEVSAPESGCLVAVEDRGYPVSHT
jgi:hypothetical protein